MIASYWLRAGNPAGVIGAAEFLRQRVTALPAHLRLGLVRGDSRVSGACEQEACEAWGLVLIFAAKWTRQVQWLCRPDEMAWQTRRGRTWPCRK